MKVYIKSLKKKLDPSWVKLNPFEIWFDREVIEGLIGKRKSECWTVTTWNKWEEKIEPLLESREWSSSVRFKNKHIKIIDLSII